jgi:hypothetical protein
MTKRRGRAADSPATSRFTTTTDAHHDTGTVDSIRLYRRQDGFAAPTAEERREAELLAELEELGYGITVPCLVCRHPLTSAKSIARHVGPKCAAKATTEAVDQ